MKILLVGCGKMGGAMLDGWLKSGISASNISVIDPVAKHSKVKVFKTAGALPKSYQADFIILAIKPQSFAEVLPGLSSQNKATVVSIIAGKKISSIKAYFPESLIIRTMPNLAATIGEGVTGAVANRKKITFKEKYGVEKLLKPCGKIVWVKDEKLIDSVTAISGSGPAYVFLFAQGLVEAAVKLGLDKETAKTLALQTIKGSVLLAEASKLELNQLKINVTSKGGTTEAALKVLENKNVLKQLVERAAKQAKQRSSELSK